MNSEPTQDHLLSNKTYDLLKTFALVVLPALGVLYAGVAAIWGLPSAEQVLATLVVVDTFLGVLIKIGDRSYNNSDAKYVGTINVIDAPDRKVFSLDLDGDPEAIENQKDVSFRVNPPL